MASLQATVRRYFTPILLLLLAGGFLVVLGELYLYHHWRGPQLIGFSATAIGMVAVLLGLFAKRGLRIGLAVLLAALSVSGLFGAYEHLESRSEGRQAVRPVLAQSTAAVNVSIAYRPSGSERIAAQEGNEGGEGAEGSGATEAAQSSEAPPPPLAPLSLAGLSLMGAAVLLAKQDE